MKEYVDVRVSTAQIKRNLRDMLLSNPHRELIASTIVDNLAETEVGLAHLYNALSGIKPTVHVKLGDDALVKFDNLPTWRMDRTKMEESGQMEKGHVKVSVKEINLQRRESIIVEYTSYKADNSQEVVTYSVSPEYVHLNNEEYPEGF